MPKNDCLDEEVSSVLSRIDDPEIGINIVDLGLVYEARRGADSIYVRMTATSRSCPLGEFMVEDACSHLAEAFPMVRTIDVELVWSPPWDPDFMTDAARSQLSAGRWI